MTRLYYYRVSLSICMEMYLPEENTQQAGAEVAPTEAARRAFEARFQQALSQEYTVHAVSLDQVVFERVEEVPD